MKKELKNMKGITLIALVITIIVLLILAGVSIAMLTGDNGIITQANNAKVANEKATAQEKVEMEVAGSRGTDGKIDYNLLNDNLRKNVKGLIYGEEEISEDNSNRITSLPAVVNVDGYALTIEENGKVTVGEGTTNEEIDWDEVLANATSPHPDQSETNTTIAVGTDGKLVNMDLWLCKKTDDGEGYVLRGDFLSACEHSDRGYIGTIKNGKIEGTIPQYIKKNEDDKFYPVTSLLHTFVRYELSESPKIPTTVIEMSGTFGNCSKLAQAPEIPESVTNMSWTFYGCSSLSQAPEIPEGVTNLGSTFSSCSSLTKAPEIPKGVTNMSWTFYGCSSLSQAPKIPEGVTNMGYTFYGCSSLSQAPEIPESVENMGRAFLGCSSLTGEIVINANPTSYLYCFENAATNPDTNLVLKGSSTKLNELLATKSSNSNITIGN